MRLPRWLRAILKPLVLFWLRSGHRDQLSRKLAPAIGELKGTVLDVGGGRPALHDRFWSPHARRIRIDVSATFRPHVVADAASLPFTIDSVDGVVMCELLEHLPEPSRAVAEAHRVLRPGGVFCGSVPFIWPLHGDPSDYFRYTRDGVRWLLRGFSKVRIRGHGNHVGAAWTLVSIRFQVLRVLNPIMRQVSRVPDDRCPEGYTFVALK